MKLSNRYCMKLSKVSEAAPAALKSRWIHLVGFFAFCSSGLFTKVILVREAL